MVNFSVFNELSLPIYSLNEFDSFFKILEKLRELGLEKIRMDRKITEYPEILPDTTFQQLLGQVRSRDKQRRLKSFINNSIAVIETPLIKEEESEGELLLENEYFYNDVSTEGGLACCDIWDSVAVSFNSNSNWDNFIVNLKKVSITGEVNIEVKNISNYSHFSNHKEFFTRLEEFTKSNITRDNFFQKRDEIFKNKVMICNEVEKQLINIDTTIFYQALTILMAIDKGKPLSDYRVSGESDSVFSDARLKNLRVFKINGEKEYFEKHIKSLSSGYRIHYFEKNDKIYIGYIGKHLSTKRFG